MDGTLNETISKTRLAIGSAGARIGIGAHEAPGFELFHAAGSICSQKVRVVLMQHQLGFISHAMNLFEGQTYLPEYVRLRMIGCSSLGDGLADFHSGSTSTASGGCDGAVVPTLVDRAAGRVIVDSKLICLYLDEQASGPRLRPPALAERIDRELAIVDELPNYQISMGSKLAARPGDIGGAAMGASFSERKVALCDRLLVEHEDDELLRRVYSAKRAKELSAATNLFSDEAMKRAYDLVEAAVAGLEQGLAEIDGAWLFGDELTLADLFWAIELRRIRSVVGSYLWDGGKAPRVEAFLARADEIPSIRSAIVDWPGAVL